MADPTEIVVQQMTGPWDTISADDMNFTFAAGTISDGDVFTCTGRELLLVYNTTGTETITIESEDDSDGRQEDITTYSLAEGDFAVFGAGLTNSKGWKNTDGQIRITVSAATVTVAVLRLPAGYGR